MTEPIRNKNVLAVIAFHESDIYATDAARGERPTRIVAPDPRGRFHQVRAVIGFVRLTAGFNREHALAHVVVVGGRHHIFRARRKNLLDLRLGVLDAVAIHGVSGE